MINCEYHRVFTALLSLFYGVYSVSQKFLFEIRETNAFGFYCAILKYMLSVDIQYLTVLVHFWRVSSGIRCYFDDAATAKFRFSQCQIQTLLHLELEIFYLPIYIINGVVNGL